MKERPKGLESIQGKSCVCAKNSRRREKDLCLKTTRQNKTAEGRKGDQARKRIRPLKNGGGYGGGKCAIPNEVK